MIRVVHPGSGFRIQIWIFYPSRITDPGVKKAPDPGSGSATLLIMQKKMYKRTSTFTNPESLRNIWIEHENIPAK